MQQSPPLVRISSGPLPPLASPWRCPGAGAVILFEGIVRPTEGQNTISALRYEVYRPMADRQLERLALELVEKHGLRGIFVEHSEGIVPVDACSFRLQVASVHRAAALQAVEEFVDRMKQQVPIWKTAIPARTEVQLT